MNREILFKAKRIDNGEWVEGYYRRIPCMGLHEHYIMPQNPKNRLEQYEIDPDTICQYTGLTDKNGQKIWENDILCGRLDDIYPENITYKKVVWDMNGFYTKEKYPTNFEILDKFDTEYFEVCGNIFDNADLLEVE